ncbi:MAG TPA: cysteine--tRNA ligase [Patescibacteria group bacterium]|nr:cysteine--tRNA ligase [Patescibacteria group bacterium]
MLRLFNTLGKKVETFTPRDPKLVTVYCCGPTVYDYAHIGNFRTYTMSDLLVRTIKYLGYPVKYVSNITDVGHLVSDSDSGEDKMEKGAKREGKTAWDIARFYTDAFLADSKKLNLLDPDVRPKPTEHIAEQIAMVEMLLSKGFAYKIDDGIYFDTSKFKDYGKLTGQSLDELKEGARVEPNPQKKNPTDFALWKFSPKGPKRDMEWESPWGVGFPGWHIECSAMSKKHLGDQIDIHTGGADLIPIHNTNEIAQSEAASGKSPFVRYWVHGQFIMVDGAKMAKSKGNFYRLADIESKGYDPLDLRYLYLTAHYRAFLNFTWTALDASKNARHELISAVAALRSESFASKDQTPLRQEFVQKFKETLEDNLNIPRALAVVWEVIRAQSLSPKERYDLLISFDGVLGLDLASAKSEEVAVPKEISDLLAKREALRKEKRFADADAVRREIEDKGYVIEDTPQGIRVKKNEKLTNKSIFHPESFGNAQDKLRRGEPGLIVLFGSGEMSPTGRKIHETVIKQAGLTAGVKIGILETPTGFEVNAIHGWPERMEQFFKTKLINIKPEITRIRAWRCDGQNSTNDPATVDSILHEDYLYCGAGSPGYTVKHLKGSRAAHNIEKAFQTGMTVCLGSATAMAVGAQVLPVYEIFKVGEELHWIAGINLFKQWIPNVVIIPHWNNQEGEDFDTTRCYMGVSRFEKLVSLLPGGMTILGIDEQTACVVDVTRHESQVLGVGMVHLIRNGREKVVQSGDNFPFG